jgi:hypothetical protein
VNGYPYAPSARVRYAYWQHRVCLAQLAAARHAACEEYAAALFAGWAATDALRAADAHTATVTVTVTVVPPAAIPA